MMDCDCPVLGFCAYSGTGKTTLLTKLLPLLKAEGLRIAVIKHAHHLFDIDQPGKDSYQLREAGADQMVIASRRRIAAITEFRTERSEPDLKEALACVDSRQLDLILVEGFKAEPFPKIELHRASLGKPLMYPHDPDIIAIASDIPVDAADPVLPQLDLNDPAAIARFVLNTLRRAAGSASTHSSSERSSHVG